MTTYYHGTSPQKAQSILESGLQIQRGTGSTFGSALYLCNELEDAKDFGFVVLAVEVNDDYVYETEIAEEDILYDDEEWADEWAETIRNQGFNVAFIEREEGFKEIVVYDLSLIGDIKIAWEHSLIKKETI